MCSLAEYNGEDSNLPMHHLGVTNTSKSLGKCMGRLNLPSFFPLRIKESIHSCG